MRLAAPTGCLGAPWAPQRAHGVRKLALGCRSRGLTAPRHARGGRLPGASREPLPPAAAARHGAWPTAQQAPAPALQPQQHQVAPPRLGAGGQRCAVRAAAGRRKSTEQPTGPGSPGALAKLTLAELRARCEELGLPTNGKKADLAERLAAAGAGGGDDDAAGGGGDAELAGVSLDELVSELTAELQSVSKPELVKCLEDRGLPTTGAKAALVQRLAVAVAEEELAGRGGPAAQQAADPLGGGDASGEREWLIADKQQALLDELMAMGVKREELLEILLEMGQTAAEGESLVRRPRAGAPRADRSRGGRDCRGAGGRPADAPAARPAPQEELAERASWLLAEEEVLLMEQQAGKAAAAGGGDALAASPSSILDGLSATDVNKMKVDDLRSYLRQLGLSDEGGRYVLRDRLMTMLAVRRAATAGDMDYLLRQLAQMTLSELRSELERRGLDLGGSKASLEMRLAQALVVEIVGPEAAGALGSALGAAAAEEVRRSRASDARARVLARAARGSPPPPARAPPPPSPLRARAQESDAAAGSPLLEPYDELLTAAVDPAATVALLCGAPPAGAGLRARLAGVAEALATANALVDELHTAPLDAAQAAAAAAAGRPGPPVPACGVVVEVYWADEDGAFHALPRGALPGLTPADLAARLPALATASFADARALAAHLAGAGVAAALPLLPGGGLALGGRLADACADAGVPLAGTPMPDSRGAALAGGRAPLLAGRAAVLGELRALGYLTLPALHVTRADVDAGGAELRAWLEEQQRARLAPGAADSAEAAAEPEAPEQPGGSALLREWAQGGAAASDDAGEEGGDGGEEGAAAPADDAPLPALAQRAAAWCGAEGIDPALQLFSASSDAAGEPLAAARGFAGALGAAVAALDADPALGGVLLEPLYRKLARWEVTVLASPEDGPVALAPAEVEVSSVLQELQDAELALAEWRMLQAGVEEADITAALDELAASAPPPLADAVGLPGLPDPLPRYALRMHVPPRCSAKVVATIRHAAAKAVGQLGLEAAGLVRVGGWLALRPDWQGRYTLPPEALLKMPDFDAGQLARMAADEAAARAGEPAPLAEYYDELAHMPDLGRFNPTTRCSAEGNGEADVLISRVEAGVPLHATSLAGLQALEVGLTPGAVARHLVNLALARAGSELSLPPPPPPETGASAQWAQATGCNDGLADIAEQMADAAQAARDEEDHAEELAAAAEARRAFAALPLDEAVSDVLTGLSTAWITPEDLATPAEEPEDWEPEFDGRSQAEVHAERDAGRAEEDLAARALRDEGLTYIAAQPIRYNRFDSGEDWVPPAIAAAAAAAEGRPVPSVRELQAQLDADAEAAAAALRERAYAPEDRLPDVSEDDILTGRLLGHDRYAGGVREALARKAKGAGDGAAAAAAAAAARGGDGEPPRAGRPSKAAPLAAAAPGDVAALAASLGSWPWPEEREVLDAAASRRPAPRVWVVTGGDGQGRQAAFRSGANIAAKLARCADLQVDVFLLPPAGAGVDEAARRAELLARRTEWQALGIPEGVWPDSMADDALAEMPPTELPPLRRQLVVAGPQALARHSVEEALESTERGAARARVSYAAAPVAARQAQDALFAAQMELNAYYVQGVGGAWGSGPDALQPPCRVLDLEELLGEARGAGAVLLLALDDSTAASGQLQQLLEEWGVPHTGMTADFAARAANRLALSKAVDEIADSLAEQQAGDGGDGGAVGLVAVPRKVFKTSELLTFLQRPQRFADAFGALLHEWDCTSVVLKPPTSAGGLGVVRLCAAADLAAFTQALADGAPRLPAGTLSDQPLPVTLPLTTPELLVAEPWVATDPVVLRGDDVEWAGASRWVEVCVGLLGELGSMSALTPTMVARSPNGARHQLTPPPAHIVPPSAVEAVQGFAVALADGLGLRSAAAVEGFVNVDSGELVVMGVQPCPDLTDGSPFLQQALLEEPPLLPHQLFRQLAATAYASHQAAVEAAAAGVGLGAPAAAALFSAPAEQGAPAELGAEDFGGLGGLGGDDLFGGGDAALDGGDGVEDADVQGLATGWGGQ
ncbi:hypothetical protein HT031_000256 [Scenedesmus sp. PABB004]|nr:hypothetical protein HT031_000256 [Scenedesmus sp. PABB004]